MRTPGLRSPFMRMYLAAFLLDGAVTCALTATPFFVLRRLGGDADLSGFAVGAQLAAYALTCLLVARLAQRRPWSLRTAMAGAFGFAIFMCFMPILPLRWLSVATAVSAFSLLALAWPPMQAWLGRDSDSKARARHVSHFNLSTSLGFATGPLLAGPVYDLDYRLAFALILVLGCTVVLILRTLPSDGVPSSDDEAVESCSTPVAHRVLYAAWLTTLLAHVGAGICWSVYPDRIEALATTGALQIRIGTRLVGSATLFSWLAFAMSISTTVVFVVMGYWIGWRQNHRYFFSILVVLAAALRVLSTTTHLGLMVASYAAVGACAGAAFTISMNFSVSHPHHRETRCALNEAMIGIGIALGGIGVGQLAGFMGVAEALKLVVWMLSLIAVVQGALLFGMRRRAGITASYR